MKQHSMTESMIDSEALADFNDVIDTCWHIVGVRSDGTVAAAGACDDGRCNVCDWSDIVAVSAGEHHTVGLKSDGTVVAVGAAEHGECDVSGWSNIDAVSAGYGYTIGLKSDGTVVAVGANDEGECGVSSWSNIIAVSAGCSHTVGLKSDGIVVAAGNNECGKCNVTDWLDIVAVSAGGDHTVGLKSDGTVIAAGANGNGQCDVSRWSDIVAVSAGVVHTIGLKSDGTIVISECAFGNQANVSNWKLFDSVNELEQEDVGDWNSLDSVDASEQDAVIKTESETAFKHRTLFKFLLIIGMACFFFPFVTVSCSGRSVDVSGMEAMAGVDAEDIDLSEAKLNYFLIGAFAFGIAGVALAFKKANRSNALGAISAVGAICLVAFRVTFESYYQFEEYMDMGMIEIEFRWGWMLALTAYVAASGVAFLSNHNQTQQDDRQDDEGNTLLSPYVQKVKEIIELYNLFSSDLDLYLLLREECIGILVWDSDLDTGLGTTIQGYHEWIQKIDRILQIQF